MQLDIGRISVRDTKLVVASKLARATPDVTMFCTSRGQVPKRRRATSSTFRRLSRSTASRPGRCIKSEEHIDILSESGSKYISYFTPAFGKAINLNELISIATGYGGDFCVLGCDGTADNTGKLG